MERDFRARDGVAIAQILLFSASLIIGIIIRIQQKNGWFCMCSFSIFRLIGASCLLATLRDDSRSVWAGVFVCESFGLIILTYLLLNQLDRVNTHLRILTRWHFRVPDIICWAGIALSVADFILASKQENAMAPNAMTQAGFGLFIAIYAWAVVLFFLCWRRRSNLPHEEMPALWCFAGAIAPMLVRISYSLIYVSTGNETFSAVVGNALAYLFMTMIPEVVVVGLVAWTTLRMSKPPSWKKVTDAEANAEEGQELNPANPKGSP